MSPFRWKSGTTLSISQSLLVSTTLLAEGKGTVISQLEGSGHGWGSKQMGLCAPITEQQLEPLYMLGIRLTSLKTRAKEEKCTILGATEACSRLSAL